MMAMPDLRMPVASYSIFATASDLDEIEAATGLTIRSAERESIVNLLNRAALDFIYSSQDEATAGQCAKFAKEAHQRCADLLETFGYSPTRGCNTESAAQFMRMWPAPILDAGFAADELDTADSLLRLFRDIQAFQNRLQALAAFHKATIQRKSKPHNELALFFTLREIYATAFERELKTSWNDDSKQHTGPGKRFCTSVIAILKRRIEASDLDANTVRATLAALHSIDDERIAQRVRTVSDMLPVRPDIANSLQEKKLSTI